MWRHRLDCGATMSLKHPLVRNERACFTIAEFCDAHRISRAKLYQLWKAGIGPRVLRVDSKVLITFEAAADWRREREAASRPTVATARDGVIHD
jgi:hypothetical protein